MTMTLHDLSIPAYINGLRALSGQLDRALAWGADNGVGELQFIASRLAPDMFPLATQVRFACMQAVQAPTRLGATGAPALSDDATDFAGLQAQIAGTIEWLGSITPEALGNDGFADLEAMIVAFKDSAASLACLCGTDAVYAKQAALAASAL